ncbi:MAG: hypothetical protein ACI8P9_002990, partial [Parasphingorhabdus sp.]
MIDEDTLTNLDNRFKIYPPFTLPAPHLLRYNPEDVDEALWFERVFELSPIA